MPKYVGWFLTLITMSFVSIAQEEGNYAIYNSKGKPASFDEMVSEISLSQVILFGEIHNDETVHKLQYKVGASLLSQGKITFGAEMLERHNQGLIDEYIQGLIDTTTLFSEADLWPNFKTDYLPLLDIAKEKECTFIATNIPRNLAKLAAKKSVSRVDSLVGTSDSISALTSPFPFVLPSKKPPYKELIKSDFGASHGMDTRKIVEAQALKDATMAHSIVQNLQDGQHFLHIHGDFHSKDRGGITYWISEYSEEKISVSVISTVESGDLKFKKDWKKQGDFILVVLESGPKSY